MIRYEVEFQDGSRFGLYGEEYFADKAVFWRHHQSHLIGFSEIVCVRGRPVTIFDQLKQVKIPFGSPLAFDQWYLTNQAKTLDFGFPHLSQTAEILREGLYRIEGMAQFLEEEIDKLKSKKIGLRRIDGGYRVLEHAARLGALSLEIILQDNPLFYQHRAISLLKEGFEIPISGNVDHPALISYAKSKHEELDAALLLKLCQNDLEQIRSIARAIEY